MLIFLPFILKIPFSSDPLPPPPPPPLPLTPSHDNSALPLMHHSWFCSLMHFLSPLQPNHQIFIVGFYELFQHPAPCNILAFSPTPRPLSTSLYTMPKLSLHSCSFIPFCIPHCSYVHLLFFPSLQRLFHASSHPSLSTWASLFLLTLRWVDANIQFSADNPSHQTSKTRLCHWNKLINATPPATDMSKYTHVCAGSSKIPHRACVSI